MGDVEKASRKRTSKLVHKGQVTVDKMGGGRCSGQNKEEGVRYKGKKQQWCVAGWEGGR